MSLESLILELDRRKKITAFIDFVIETNLMDAPKNRVKRGIIHDLVAHEMGVQMSPQLRRAVNERMENAGYSLNILHGYAYFRDVAIRRL